MSAGGKAPGRNVAWNKPQEPAFLKAFKEKVGYKEPSTIDAKREVARPPRDDDREDREDELPTVVVLRSGDVSQEEFMQYRKTAKEKSEEDMDSGGKITFKKPTKRRSSEEGILDASTSKKPKPSPEHSSSRSVGTGHKKTKSKAVKNKSLLSFGGDEEEQ